MHESVIFFSHAMHIEEERNAAKRKFIPDLVTEELLKVKKLLFFCFT